MTVTLGAALMMAAMTYAPATVASTSTRFRVRLDRETGAEPHLTLSFPQGPRRKLELDGEDPPYRIFATNVDWPAGNSDFRADFVLEARLTDQRTNAIQLRLGRRTSSVEVYLFDRTMPRCQRQFLNEPRSEEQAAMQMALAEAALRPQAYPCSIRSLRYWTEAWLARARWLLQRNNNLRLNSAAIADFRAAFRARQTPFPPEYQTIVAELERLDEDLSKAARLQVTAAPTPPPGMALRPRAYEQPAMAPPAAAVAKPPSLR